MSDSLISPEFSTSDSSQQATRCFRFCFAVVFFQALGLMFKANVVTSLMQQFGLLQGTAGNIFGGGLLLYPAALIASSFFIERLGYRRFLLSSILLQLFFVVTILTSPILFAMLGANGVFYWLSLGSYAFAIGSGIGEATVNPLVANLFPTERTRYLNYLHAASPAGYIAGNLFFSSNNVSSFAQAILFLLPLLALGLLLFYKFRPEVSPALATEPQRPFRLAILPLATPFFLLLFALQLGIDFSELRLEACKFSIVTDVSGTGVLKTFFVVVAIVTFAIRYLVGQFSISRFVTDFELLAASTLFLFLGMMALASAGTSSKLFEAFTFIAIGSALLKPTMLALVYNRYFIGGAAVLGLFAGASTLICLPLIRFVPLLPEHPTAPDFRKALQLLAIVPGLIAMVYASLLYRLGSGEGYKALAHVHWPENRILATFLGWGTFGWILGVGLARKAATAQEWVGQFFLKIVYGYFFGPLWSDFAWLWIPGVLLYLYISFVILFRRTEQVAFAKAAFTLLVGLALFCIWVEPWLTVSGILLNAVSAYFKLAAFTLVDIAATAIWLWARNKVHLAFDNYFDVTDATV